MVENYNGVNDYIFFGKSGELPSNRREEQEISMICLQILQSCLGFINTLMIQDTLADPEWVGKLGDADRRGLTPLFTVNMTPYGEIQLNLDRPPEPGYGRRPRCLTAPVTGLTRPTGAWPAETPQMAAGGSSLTNMPGPRGRAGQSSQMSPVSVIAANPCRVRSRLAVPVIVVILLSW